MSTGRPTEGAFARLSYRSCTIQRSGSIGTKRAASAGTDVKGESKMSPLPCPRYAISVATAAPSDWPCSTSRPGSTPAAPRTSQSARSAT
jgi:hypothetical protein